MGRVTHARRHFKRPSWMWRWHHLISVFIVFFGIGMVAASMQFNTQKFSIAQAAVGGNMAGWIWADPIGWTSVSSTQPGACPGPGSCGSYGLNLDPVSKEINGFTWNDSAGWICFGSSCASVGSACASVPPTGNPADLKAWIDSISFPAPSSVSVHGWANICNLGADGWISLNCEEAPGSGGVGCPSLSYKYHAIFTTSPQPDGKQYFGVTTPPPDSYGWNGNVGGTGYGYFDFARMYFLPPPENTIALCTDGLDNNLNGAVDCADPSCAVLPICLPESACGAGAAACCSDGVDNNSNGLKDCADPSCSALAVCTGDPENPSHHSVVPGHTLDNACGDGVDNNGNGLVDCADPICATYAGCTLSQAPGTTYIWTTSSTSGGSVSLTVPTCLDGVKNGTATAADCADPACATEPACLGPAPTGDVSSLTPGGSDQPLIDFLCSDGLDNGKADGVIDCQDPTCQTKSTVCGSFIQAKFGNIYAQQGITGAPSRPSRGSYCLDTTGAISNFSSDSGCSSSAAGSISLPSQSTSYQGSLGSLDINGILNGRYGTVIPIVSDVGIPAVLDGKVYYSSGNLTLNAKTFANGGAQNAGHAVTERGNGLLVVNGTLTITGNVGYQAQLLPTSVRNLSSFGVIVKKDPVTHLGGDIYINPGVTSISGAYFAENKIYTGTNSPAADTPLQVFGIMAAKQFSLQRVYPSSTTAAEQFIQDGRAVANPPPGMTEIGKTLPVQKDAF